MGCECPFAGPSWTGTRIDVRISTRRRSNLWTRRKHTDSQDLPFPGCMRLPVICRMWSPALVNWLRRKSDWIRIAS
jgi:hypothetical protein